MTPAEREAMIERCLERLALRKDPEPEKKAITDAFTPSGVVKEAR